MKDRQPPGFGPLAAMTLLVPILGPAAMVMMAIWLGLFVFAWLTRAMPWFVSMWKELVELQRIGRDRLRYWYDNARSIAIIRLRARHSVKVLAGFMVIWTVLAGTIFWAEPVLIWQLVRYGRFGLGDVTFSVYLSGVLAWLVPLFVYQVLGLWTDAVIAYNDRDIPSDNWRKRLGPGEYHAAYNPMAPVRRVGVANFKDFTDWHYSKEGMGLTVLGAVVLAFFAGTMAFAREQESSSTIATSWQRALVAGAVIAYLVIAVSAYLAVTTMQSDFDGSSMFLPWRQPWTWLYLLATLPMAAYQLVALTRLLLPPLAKALAEVIYWPDRSPAETA